MTSLATVADSIATVLRAGGCVYACGNGGSMAQASHFVGELIGRMDHERRPLRAVALSDSAILSALANDYGTSEMFARQVRVLVQRTDALVCFSTSGTSANIVSAMREAHVTGAYAVLATGRDSPTNAHHVLRVPVNGTREIQEAQVVQAHHLVQQIEERLGLGRGDA